jgi:putative ABC transport system permease protein
MRMIVLQTGAMTLAGLALGIAAALASGRLIERLLFDVNARDSAVFAATALALFGMSILACWLPARRAARLNPVDVLRMD